MCGILGIRRFDGGTVDEALLRAMAARLAHRGADGEGYWTDGPVGFGHRRLSIIDLAGSAQPMASAEGTSHLTFNGEILNYRALRAATPYPYRTSGDTETLLAVHHAHGEDGVTRLRGQFAYAIYDERDGRLRLVRDRLGILPLYYYADDHMLAFASEIKALLPALPAPPSVDHAALGDYLTGRSVPSPNTLFEGIRKLPPAHVLRVEPDGACTAVRYWQLPAPPDQAIPAEEAVAKVADTLDDAVAAALVADVPVGSYLSGGVDSSLIVAVMVRLRDREGIETFSAGFDDPRVDELQYARQVSRHLGVRNSEVVVRPKDFEDLWPKLTWHRGAPISEPADIAVFRLAQTARERVKVILSGEGSDELFAGYPKYRAARLGAAAGAVPAPIRAFAARALPASNRRAKVARQVLTASPDRTFAAWFSPFTEDELERLLGGPPGPWQPGPVKSARGDVVRRMLEVDSQAWLADNVLERGDRMSTAASLELRPPFLDHRIAELAFTLPTNVKVRGRHGKWVVKQVASRYLPAEIVHRRKVGFRVPLDAWFRDGLRQMARDRVLDHSSFVAGALRRPTLEQLFARHDRGDADEQMAIWTLLSLEVWHEVFFRLSPPPLVIGPDEIAHMVDNCEQPLNPPLP